MIEENYRKIRAATFCSTLTAGLHSGLSAQPRTCALPSFSARREPPRCPQEPQLTRKWALTNLQTSVRSRHGLSRLDGPSGGGGVERCEGRSEGAWPLPGAPPRPRPTLSRAHIATPQRRLRRSDPRCRGRRCSGAPRGACACGSASGSSAASTVGSPPVRVRGWRRGGRSHRASVGLHRRVRTGDRASVILGAPGETGPGDRGTDTGRSTAGPARAPG